MGEYTEGEYTEGEFFMVVEWGQGVTWASSGSRSISTWAKISRLMWDCDCAHDNWTY